MDSDPLTNNGGAYRTTGVDLKAELDGSIVVGWMPAGEWLEYTVNVPVAGSFVWQFRMNALEVGRKLDIYVDDQLQFSVNVPVTAAWGELATTAVFDKPLAAGEHIIRVQNAGGDFLDFDFFTIGTLPAGCRGDYDYSGTLDILDLAPFAQNYRMEGVSCDLDIVETEQACYLDIADLAEFARPYLSEQACALP
jgi:hypothetical protein